MSATTTTLHENHEAMQGLLLRGATVIGLAGIALIHLIDLPDKLEEAPAIGVLYIGLIVASLLAAGALIARDSKTAFAVSAGLAIATLIGYAVSRTVGLPGAGTEDVGNWLEPLGLASLFVEACTAATALWGMRRSTQS